MDVSKVRIHLKNRQVTPEAMLKLLARDSKQAANACRGGVKIEAEPAVLDTLRGSALGRFIDDDGEVTTSAVTGVEEIVAALIVGACIGFLGGLGAGILATSGNSNSNGDEGDGEEEGGEDPGGEGGTDPE